MSAELQVVVSVTRVPHDSETHDAGGRVNIAVNYAWIIDGQPQPAADLAMVIRALKMAQHAVEQQVAFAPPLIVQPATVIPPGVM